MRREFLCAIIFCLIINITEVVTDYYIDFRPYDAFLRSDQLDDIYGGGGILSQNCFDNLRRLYAIVFLLASLDFCRPSDISLVSSIMGDGVSLNFYFSYSVLVFTCYYQQYGNLFISSLLTKVHDLLLCSSTNIFYSAIF